VGFDEKIKETKRRKRKYREMAAQRNSAKGVGGYVLMLTAWGAVEPQLASAWGKAHRQENSRHSLSEMAQIHGRITERLKEPDSLTGSSCDGLVEDLREISEILLWGEQNDHQELFDYFCEKEMLGNFVKVISMPSIAVAVKIQLLQTMSLLTQNLRTRSSLIYVFSNDHINNLISAPCDWSADEELLSYYVTFVKGLALRLDPEMLTLFFHSDQFVLYTVPIRLYNSADAMVRTSVRTLTLAIYQVADRSCMDFLVANSGGYFALLSKGLREQWQKLGDLSVSRRVAESAVDDVVDVLLYIADIFTVENPTIQPLLDLLVDKLSMYALEPLLSPPSQSPRGHCSRTLSKFIVLQLMHYVDVPIMRERMKELRPSVFGLHDDEETIVVLDAAMIAESPELLPEDPELPEKCLRLVEKGFNEKWHIITIQLLLAVYRMTVRDESSKTPNDRSWRCFRTVAETARKTVLDGPRGLLYREAIASAEEELGEAEGPSAEGIDSIVSTIASTPPGRPGLLPPPSPVKSPGKYTIDFISLLRRELLPGISKPPCEDPERALASSKEGSTFDLGQSDRLSCSCIALGSSEVNAISQAQMTKSAEALYVILWNAAFLLAAPERTRPGYGIVRHVAPMATTEVSLDREKPCQLKVKLRSSSNLVLVFPDESRCRIAYQHLESSREESLKKQYRALVDRFLLSDEYGDDKLRGV
ncbi:Protein CL16A, partial [Perkinsus olseni]